MFFFLQSFILILYGFVLINFIIPLLCQSYIIHFSFI